MATELKNTLEDADIYLGFSGSMSGCFGPLETCKQTHLPLLFRFHFSQILLLGYSFVFVNSINTDLINVSITLSLKSKSMFLNPKASFQRGYSVVFVLTQSLVSTHLAAVLETS